MTATAPTANPPVVNTGDPGVEANSRATGDESETRESPVRGGIGYHQGFGAADGV
jgi:hypothetical protein